MTKIIDSYTLKSGGQERLVESNGRVKWQSKAFNEKRFTVTLSMSVSSRKCVEDCYYRTKATMQAVGWNAAMEAAGVRP